MIWNLGGFHNGFWFTRILGGEARVLGKKKPLATTTKVSTLDFGAAMKRTLHKRRPLGNWRHSLGFNRHNMQDKYIQEISRQFQDFQTANSKGRFSYKIDIKVGTFQTKRKKVGNFSVKKNIISISISASKLQSSEKQVEPSSRW